MFLCLPTLLCRLVSLDCGRLASVAETSVHTVESEGEGGGEERRKGVGEGGREGEGEGGGREEGEGGGGREGGGDRNEGGREGRIRGRRETEWSITEQVYTQFLVLTVCTPQSSESPTES